MNNKVYLQQTMKQSIYELKQGTSSSYYYKSGSKMLPRRISITNGEVTGVAKKGRNMMHTTTGQLLGQFTMSEDSPLKQNKPYIVRTQLWQNESFPSMQYGSIGISNKDGKISRESDFGDVVILYKISPTEYHISFFPSIAQNPDLLDDAFSISYETRKGLNQ